MGDFVLCEDITPFYFPCPNCEAETLHRVCEEFGGVTYKIPFMKKPLFASQRTNQLICATCTMINGRLTDSDVGTLRTNTLPKSIHERYPKVAMFYSLETIERIREKFREDPESLAFFVGLVKAYRLEL